MAKVSNVTGLPLRLGVVGCGRVFENYHWSALQQSPDWDLVAVCESSEGRRAWARQINPEIEAFASFSKFLNQCPLDALLITTPPATHGQLVVQALAAGLPVLVEKPMALTLPEAHQMAQASQRAAKPLWVGFNRRFRQPYIEFKQVLAQLPQDVVRAIRFQLTFDKNWQPVTPYLGRDDQGGGSLDDVASHQIDLLCWLFNQEIEAVKAAQSIDSVNNCNDIHYQVRFENGLVAECSAGHNYYYKERLEVDVTGQKVIVYPNGLLRTSLLPAAWINLYCRLKTDAHLISHKMRHKPNVTLDSFIKQLAAFAAHIRHPDHTSNGADAASGLRTLQVIEACRASIDADGVWQMVISQGEKVL